MKLLLLRGLLREKRHWGEFPEILKRTLSSSGLKCEVECIDLPGIGTQQGRSCPLDMDKVVQDLRARSEILHQKQKMVIVSNSLGSMISMQWAHLYPEDIEGLVLMNTSASNLGELGERISVEALATFAKVIVHEDAAKRESLILRLVSNKYSEDPVKLQEWASLAMRKKDMLSLGLRQLWLAAKFKLDYKLDLPSLMLCSIQDRLINPTACMKVAKALGSEQRFNHSAGHDLPLDDPEWVSQEISLWLSQWLSQSIS